MTNKIEVFLFVFSIIFTLKYIVEVIINLSDDVPNQIKISKVELISIFIAISYIITFLIL